MPIMREYGLAANGLFEKFLNKSPLPPGEGVSRTESGGSLKSFRPYQNFPPSNPAFKFEFLHECDRHLDFEPCLLLSTDCRQLSLPKAYPLKPLTPVDSPAPLAEAGYAARSGCEPFYRETVNVINKSIKHANRSFTFIPYYALIVGNPWVLA
jgi:hypothetical protein